MPIYLLVNEVMPDGIGDFTHFEDMVRYVRNDPNYSDVKWIAVVIFAGDGSPVNYAAIQRRLSALDIEFYYYRANYWISEQIYIDPCDLLDAELQTNPDLREQLTLVDQVIRISTHGLPLTRFLNAEIPQKYILEHEYTSLSSSGMRALGLSE